MERFFISDLHLGHTNVLRFDGRPFSSVEEMDHFIINEWNSVVSNGDHVYVVGDIIWTSPDSALEYLSQLKGQIHLILGNHDQHLANSSRVAKKFVEITQYKEFREYKKKFVLSHVPIPWHPSHRSSSSVHFYGHVHMTTEFKIVLDAQKALMEQTGVKGAGMAFNVGANLPYMNYRPRTAEEIVREGLKFNQAYYDDPINSFAAMPRVGP